MHPTLEVLRCPLGILCPCGPLDGLLSIRDPQAQAAKWRKFRGIQGKRLIGFTRGDEGLMNLDPFGDGLYGKTG